MTGLPERVAAHWLQDVVVTGPTGAVWTGKLVAYLGQPSLVLAREDGSQVHVAASFQIDAAPEPARHTPRLVVGLAAYCAGCGRALRFRDGWWRTWWSSDATCAGTSLPVAR